MDTPQKMVECPTCGTKNRIPDRPREDGIYRCGSCKETLTISTTGQEKAPVVGGQPPKEMAATVLEPHVEQSPPRWGDTLVLFLFGASILGLGSLLIFSLVMNWQAWLSLIVLALVSGLIFWGLYNFYKEFGRAAFLLAILSLALIWALIYIGHLKRLLELRF